MAIRRTKRPAIAKQRYCYFCVNGIPEIDARDPKLLSKFLSSYGKIAPRRRSGVCAKHQRRLSQAVKRARQLAIIPTTSR